VGRTLFVELGPWLRDEYVCVRCRSIPRWRAVIEVIEQELPDWRDRPIFEASPGGGASDKLRREGRRYLASHYFPDAEPGSTRDGVRCEDLERLTLADDSFDLVVTQDVLEHVLRPEAAFREIDRVLRPGGLHVFTVPIFHGRATEVRAEPDGAGGIRNLAPADYHGNPTDPNGSLVVREWGDDLLDLIADAAPGTTTTVSAFHDRSRGLDGELLDVLVTRRTR
jgi:SAM-dependent methyltransferase